MTAPASNIFRKLYEILNAFGICSSKMLEQKLRIKRSSKVRKYHMSNVSLIKSRFFVENKDFDDAMEKVFNGGDYADWRVDYTRDAFDPTKKPSPFTDVDSLLKAFGFSTFKASDESIWIVDFKDSILSDFEFRNMVKVLLILSSFNLESFICIKEDEVEYLIEGGDLKNPRDYRSRPNFSDFKVGRSPFPPHFFNS